MADYDPEKDITHWSKAVLDTDIEVAVVQYGEGPIKVATRRIVQRKTKEPLVKDAGRLTPEEFAGVLEVGNEALEVAANLGA